MPRPRLLVAAAALPQQRCASLAPKTVERRSALAALASSIAAPAHAKSYQSGLVFEGGAGGLTKTKPNTGVKTATGAVDDKHCCGDGDKNEQVVHKAHTMA